MVNAKKALSWIISLFLILSSTAFAQYDPGYYEGRPIDPSREGTDYYTEGDVIVYPSDSGPGNMRDRYVYGNFDEEQMRKDMMEKYGAGFNEEEFQKMMMEPRERMERREPFSYEHGGYESMYYESPSYEGYSKEHMVYGMVFQYIGDEIDPREIMQYCNEPEKIADIVISKLMENVGDVQNICSRIEDQESDCEEDAKKSCERIGKPYVREGATEMEKINAIAYSCPPNRDALTEACKKRNEYHIKQRFDDIDAACKERFDYDGERRISECEQFKRNMICDKGKFISQCMGGIEKSDDGSRNSFADARWECYDGTTESRTGFCRAHEEWIEDARKSCENKCSSETGKCGVNSFSVGGECREDSKHECPSYPVPDCREGNLVRRTDERGCEYHYCEQKRQCPESQMPTCPSNAVVEKKSDENGCTYYYCKYSECPQIEKPACASDERIAEYRDEKGCIKEYECVKYQTCPEPARPTCAEDQIIVSKNDEKGCIFYECAASGQITGAVTGAEFENQQRRCEEMWIQQHSSCQSMPKICDKESFTENCKEEEKKYASEHRADFERECKTLIEPEIRAMEDRCSRLKEEKDRCIEHATKRCSQIAGLAEHCRTILTEENLRKFIIEEAKKRCRFSDIIEHESEIERSDRVEIILAVLNTAAQSDIEKLGLFVDGLEEELRLEETTVYKGTISPKSFGDIKLLPFVVNAKISAASGSGRSKEVKTGIVAGSAVKEAAGKLISLRDSNVPSEYLYIIEDKASDVLDAADALEDIGKKEEGKGFGYKIRLFLGLAKAAEQEEIKQLESSKSKLQNSIDTLSKLADEVPSYVANAILKEQVENLKQQQADIEILIETKQKKAKGLFGVFG